ncbi:hypothetical protein L9F63_002724, partial [Diploptera punctata]
EIQFFCFLINKINLKINLPTTKRLQFRQYQLKISMKSYLTLTLLWELPLLGLLLLWTKVMPRRMS